MWLAFAAALLFIGRCVSVAVDAAGEDYAAAQHEVELDELWDGIDFDEGADDVDFGRLLA